MAEIIGTGLDLTKEMAFLAEIFDSDAKNYHAWTYRIWLVERFQLWEGELAFVDDQLLIDVENNSVWSYRYFLVNKSPVGTFNQFAAGTKQFAEVEVKYTMEKLAEGRANEAAWVYLRGMFAISPEEAEQSQKTKVKRVLITEAEDYLLPWLD